MSRMAVAIIAAAGIASTNAAVPAIPTAHIAKAIDEYSAQIEDLETGELAVTASPMSAPPRAPAQGQQQPAGTISGMVFGDLYYLSQHHNPMFEGMNGLWFRRLYLTYDHRMDSQTTSRVRLEAASAGDFTSTSSMTPFIKDLYLQHTLRGGHRVQLGMIGTPPLDLTESALAYRHIERTPLDLWRLSSSRDQGLSVRGPLGAGTDTMYHLMVGNNSGTSTENNKEKAVYAALTHKITPEITLEGYVDYLGRPDGMDRRTLKGEAVYRNGPTRAGFLIAEQERKDPMGNMSIGVWSLFASHAVSPTVRPFFRIDGLSRAVPDAASIAYMVLSPDATPTLFMGGVEFQLTPDVSVTPNFQYVSYSDFKGGEGKGEAPRDFLMFRVTFFWQFR